MPDIRRSLDVFPEFPPATSPEWLLDHRKILTIISEYQLDLYATLLVHPLNLPPQIVDIFPARRESLNQPWLTLNPEGLVIAAVLAKVPECKVEGTGTVSNVFEPPWKPDCAGSLLLAGAPI